MEQFATYVLTASVLMLAWAVHRLHPKEGGKSAVTLPTVKSERPRATCGKCQKPIYSGPIGSDVDAKGATLKYVCEHCGARGSIRV